MQLSGTKLVGSNAERGRVENDYYATPLSATETLIVDGLQECFLGSTILEPSAGEGHIVKVLDTYYPDCKIIANDLVERKSKFGYKINGGIDFLTYEPKERIDTVITNPPFKLAQEFIEKGLSIAKKYVIIFAKIQLLEGEKRRKLFEHFPPHYIYVFSKRVNPLRNGEEFDENGKPWASTMCFAWFVWEKGYTGDSVVRWL